MKKTASSPRRPGRPREFDMHAALTRAARVFRERGYHATSIVDLMAAMQLASGSVYKAFKDKQALFDAVFEHEATTLGAELRRVLDAAPSGRERVRAVLAFYAAASSGAEGKRGCIVISSAAELTTFTPEFARRVVDLLRGGEKLMLDLIRQGQADGSIPAAVDSAATARLLVCLLQGMRVAGKIGRSLTDMMAVVDTAMKLLS